LNKEIEVEVGKKGEVKGEVGVEVEVGLIIRTDDRPYIKSHMNREVHVRFSTRR